MTPRSDSATAVDPSSIAIANPTARRSKFSVPLRFTISQLMILTSIVGLAMAPLAMIRKHDRIELIVAMVAFELIGLPALITIILLSTMKPGPARLKTIAFLSLLPTILLTSAVGLVCLAGFPFSLKMVALDFANGNFRQLPMLGVIVYQILYASSRFHSRCPACHLRRLRYMRPPPENVRKWFVTFECQECGKLSCRNMFKLLARPRQLAETETGQISSSAG
ncbi:hypothetical protein V5E97_13475 [Singulisphaera sp. Ch08]|uniref:Uncharacterized protein n=1 Tax=Singulisphaera sp. Ch08 TaxID=3120278 RepID=A0AAU7CPI5_9BACT